MNRRLAMVRAGQSLPWASMLVSAATAGAQTLTIGRQDYPAVSATISEHVVTEAARRAGVALVMRPLPLPRLIESANQGEVDGDLMRIADVVDRYPNLVKVPTPINQVDVAVYGRSEAMHRMPRAEVAKLRIAYARGTFIVAKHAAGLKTVQTKSIEQAFEMLANQRVDAVMGAYLDAEEAVAGQHMAGIVRWPIAWASEPVYLLLHKRNAEWVPRLDAALRQMKRERLIETFYVQGLQAARITPLAPPDLRAP